MIAWSSFSRTFCYWISPADAQRNSEQSRNVSRDTTTGSALTPGKQHVINWVISKDDTVEIHFFAVRSPRFWVRGYCTKCRIQGSFWKLVPMFIKHQDCQETENSALILPDKLVPYICHKHKYHGQGTQSLHSGWNFTSSFTELHDHGNEHWPTEVTSNCISVVSQKL